MVAPLKFGNGKIIYPTLYCTCDYLTMQGLKLLHFGKGATGSTTWLSSGSTIYRRNCYLKISRNFGSTAIEGLNHYNDVIIGMMASQITSLTIVYSTANSGACSTANSGACQRKHQSSTSLAVVRGMHRWPVNPPHKWPVTRKMFSFHEVIMANGE